MLIFGLFAMHGLTSGHDVAPLPTVTGSHEAAATAMQAITTAVDDLPGAGHRAGGAIITTAASALSALPTDDMTMRMGSCLAVLNSSLLLLVLALALARSQGEQAFGSADVSSGAPPPASAPPRPPQLSHLCISRT